MTVQNLSVEVRPLLGAMGVALLNEYPITAVGTGLQASLGDLFGGEERKLVFRLLIPGLAELGSVSVAEVVVRWADITSRAVELHTRTIPLSVNVVPEDEVAAESGDPALTEQVVILEAARARKEARRLADSGDFESARRLLAEHSENLRAIPETSQLFAMAFDDLEELEGFDHRLETRAYDRIDSKALYEQSRRRGRSQEYPKRPDRP
jgi:Ca-activated chloride channel family protein